MTGGRMVSIYYYPVSPLLDVDIYFIAKLAISIARKMNALIFLVPEDIVDVRPRLVSSNSFVILDCIY